MENLSELMYGAVMFFVAPREDDVEEVKSSVLDKKTLSRLDSLHSMRHYSKKARVNNERSMVEARATEMVERMEKVDRFRNAKSFDLANETNPLLVVGGRNSVRSISKLKGLMILDQMKKEQQQRNIEKQAKVFFFFFLYLSSPLFSSSSSSLFPSFFCPHLLPLFSPFPPSSLHFKKKKKRYSLHFVG
jgi:hypothetical protein